MVRRGGLRVLRAHASPFSRNPYVAALAPENEFVAREIRHIVFRTRHGRPYRALFTIVGNEVRILRVRGPGQAPLNRLS
jgi:hypothetical protein